MRNKLFLFNQSHILNKHEPLYSLSKFKEHFEETDGDERYSKEKISILINLIESFISKINESDLPDLNRWWFYDYNINNFDIKLSIYYCSEVEYNDEGYIDTMTISETYDIISLQCKMLTVNEFITAEPLHSGVKYCPPKEPDEIIDLNILKHINHNEEIITNYGCVFVTKGIHKGRIGIYDDNEDGKAIVYFGDMYITDEYYEIPYSYLSRTVPTLKLTERMKEIYPEFNQFRYIDKKQKELLIEYILCYNILNERYLNSMNTLNTTKEIQIFISHATKDMYFARTIATDLMEAGYSVFLDDWSTDIGERINEKINEGLEMCNALVMIISESY